MTQKDTIDKEMKNQQIFDDQIVKKSNLSITYFGFKLQNKIQLKTEIMKYNEKIFRLDYEQNDFYLPYYLGLSSLKYSETIRIEQIQQNYLENLVILYIYKQNNETDLINLIKKCKKLKFLTINDSFISQQFLDYLPEICELNRFNFEYEDIKLDVNFQFIARFQYLKCFLTNYQLKSNEFLDFLDQIYCLVEIQFKAGEKFKSKFKIKKTGQNKYEMLVFDLKFYEKLCDANVFEKLFKKLDKISLEDAESLFSKFIENIYIKIQKGKTLNQLVDFFDKNKDQDPDNLKSLKKRLRPMVKRALKYVLKKLACAVILKPIIDGLIAIGFVEIIEMITKNLIIVICSI